MTKKTQKQILFERMNSVAGMPINENYPWGAEHDPAAPWNEPEYSDEEMEEFEPDPDERHDIDHGEMDEGKPMPPLVAKPPPQGGPTQPMIDEEADSPKRWNNVSVWINQASEEDMKNAGFEFDPKGNADLFYNGKKVGYVSNFNGVMLDDEYVDELIPLFQSFRGTGVWNYDGWKEDVEQRKKYFGEAHGLQEDDDWIQGAVNPAHKGYCTPMTKDTCTPKRKALAKRFKAGIEDEGVNEIDVRYSQRPENKIKHDPAEMGLNDAQNAVGGFHSQSQENGTYQDINIYLGAYLKAVTTEIQRVMGHHIQEENNTFLESVRGTIKEYEELGQGEKFRAEITGKGENRWSGNAMEYDTEEEAKEWLNNLANRWFGYDMSRVVPVSVPTGQQVDMENDVIYQNFRDMNEGKFDDYDDEEDPDAGHTVNGKLLSPEEYRRWKEEEGEYDDMDKQNRPRW